MRYKYKLFILDINFKLQFLMFIFEITPCVCIVGQWTAGQVWQRGGDTLRRCGVRRVSVQARQRIDHRARVCTRQSGTQVHPVEDNVQNSGDSVSWTTSNFVEIRGPVRGPVLALHVVLHGLPPPEHGPGPGQGHRCPQSNQTNWLSSFQSKRYKKHMNTIFRSRKLD